jgi:transposase-like protein
MVIETPTVTLQNPRELRGLALLSKGDAIRMIDDSAYMVRSQSVDAEYRVWNDDINWKCECPDFKARHTDCKHIFAVFFSQKLKLEARKGITEDSEAIQNPMIVCPSCHDSKVIRSGQRKTGRGSIQRYECKSCSYRFAIDRGFSRMKSDPKAILVVMDLYFKGVSLRKIVHHLKQFYSVEVNASTVLRWIQKYVKLLTDYVSNITPEVSDLWNIDEASVNIREKGKDGNREWIWQLMDSETRFLLASRITKQRGLPEAKKALMEGKELAGKSPRVIFSDGHQAYPDAIRSVFYSNRAQDTPVFHYRVQSIRHDPNNNVLERLNGTWRERLKVMRGLDSEETAQTIIDGERFYYNFVRPHSALGGMVPAQLAKISLPTNWKGLIALATEKRAG